TLMLGEGHSNNTFHETSVPAQSFTCDGDGSPWYGAWAMINGYNLSALASNGQQLINRPWAHQWGALPLDDQTSSPVYSSTLGCYAFPQVFDPPYNRHP
ncbi:MAG: hypothetical protein M3Y27_30160, partial [Acidobacteriota bacterium]|nr:hypothetical protein [Acidobacteriota bacterium]